MERVVIDVSPVAVRVWIVNTARRERLSERIAFTPARVNLGFAVTLP